MTEQQRKAMEMALKFIVVSSAKDKAWYTTEEFEVVSALRQALAQPEQEPVSQWYEGYNKGFDAGVSLTPPKHEWVGLDEDRVAYLADKYAPPIDPAFTKDDDYWRFYQEIELELKEKNT